MFDTDGSGAIGNEELKQAMFSMGMNANEAEIDNVIREVLRLLSCCCYADLQKLIYRAIITHPDFACYLR